MDNPEIGTKREVEHVDVDISQKPYDEEDRRVKIVVQYKDKTSDVIFAKSIAILHRNEQETIDKKYEE